MKIETRTVDKERGILQVTTTDERWYMINGRFIPSVTWICDYYPKGIGFYKWLAGAKNWDEAEALKVAAGDKGSRVHHACGDLLDGNEVSIDSRYSDSSGMESVLTLEEYECVMSFAEWFEEAKPIVLCREFVVANLTDEYAGMVDLFCMIDNYPWLIDLKTSPNIWPSHELQVSAYRQADTPVIETEMMRKSKLAILQVGYKKNKYKKYKFTEVHDKYPEFMAARRIWMNETSGVEPKQKDYPLSLKLKGINNGTETP